MSAAPTKAAKPIASATGGMRRRSPPSVQPAGEKAHPASVASPRHEQSDALLVGPPLWEVRQDPPFEHDQHAVGQRKDFAQLRRHQKNRAASVALGDELLVDMFGRANVQPSRRLLRNQRRRFMREFARNHDLLQIAAR